jgi:diadenosine tetraphosphate (Ap4A) HIT family hydrolase
MSASSTCDLCAQPGGEVILRNEKLRIVLIDDANYPGFCRVIWNDHVKEMSDLAPTDRALLMSTVWQVEEAVRATMRPDKMNIASFGNMVPHLHWHVIPRYVDDVHFPDSIWAGMKRLPMEDKLAVRRDLLVSLREVIARLGDRIQL